MVVSAKATSANRFTKDPTMTNFAKLKAVAAVSAACAGLFGATSAQAYVYAVSHLEIQALSLNITPTATINNFTFDQTNTASLNSGPVATGASCNKGGLPACGAGPVLDAAVANAPGSVPVRGENNFGFLGVNNVSSYSSADSVLTTAQLVTGTPTSLNQIAESLLNTNGFAKANALQQSNTSMVISLTVAGGPASLSFNFNADPDQRSQIGGPDVGAYLSQSDMNASFTLSRSSQDGGGSVNWTPSGTAGVNDCNVIGLAGVVCTETADGADLNDNTTTGTNPGVDDNSFEVANIFAAFGINITGLAAGNYTLALNAQTSTSIVRNVPEPGALALMGIALAGLAFTAKRRQSKQA
jgi:hypothetical protein